MEKLFCVRFLRDVYSGGFRNSHLMLCSKVRKCGKMTWCEYFLDPQRFCVQLRARPGRTGLVIAPFLLSVTRRAKSGLDRVINEKIFPGFRFRHRMLPPHPFPLRLSGFYTILLPLFTILSLVQMNSEQQAVKYMCIL